MLNIQGPNPILLIFLVINDYISLMEIKNPNKKSKNLECQPRMPKNYLKNTRNYFARLQKMLALTRGSLLQLFCSCVYFPQQIFRPPLDHYDVIIHLHSRLLPRRTQALDKGKNPAKEASSSCPSVLLPVVNFDPAQLYLKELKVRKDSTSNLKLFLA